MIIWLLSVLCGSEKEIPESLFEGDKKLKKFTLKQELKMEEMLLWQRTTEYDISGKSDRH